MYIFSLAIFPRLVYNVHGNIGSNLPPIKKQRQAIILNGGQVMKEKVILAYSGGLDTTAIIPWLKENFDYDVVCCCIDCGQDEELDGLEERAKLSGASKLYIEDITDEFAEEYIIPCVQAGAVYENKYLLGTSMARPGIAKRLVEIARKEGAAAICHGATGKGNDQIRFELGIKALAPDLKIIAAWRSDKWTCSPGKMKSPTAGNMASTFHFLRTAATAGTGTCGISAMRGWNWKTLHASLITAIS